MSTPTQLRAAVYLRVSTKVQNEETQLPDILKQIHEDNALFSANKFVFRDKISGLKEKDERQGLSDLLKLSKNDIDIVYIWEISRLSRNPTYFDELITMFRKKRINICFLKPMPLYLFNKQTGEEDMITTISLKLFSTFALFEIQQKGQRQQRGKREAIVTRDECYTGKTAYGYTKANKKLILNDIDIVSDVEGYRTEKEVIQRIFELYSNGKTLMQISKILNTYNIPTRSKSFIKADVVQINKTTTIKKEDIKWGKRSIAAILSNTIYMGLKDTYSNIKTGTDDNGKAIIKTETKQIITPSIVTEELYLLAQRQKGENRTKAVKTYSNEYLLRGLLVCGGCGKSYLGTTSKGKEYYRCADATVKSPNTKLGCKSGTINALNIDFAVWQSIKDNYKIKLTDAIKQKNVGELISKVSFFTQDNEYKRLEIDKLEKEQSNLSKRLAFVPDSQAETIISEISKRDKDIAELKNQLFINNNEIATYNSQIDAINSNDTDSLVIDSIDENYTLKKEAIQKLVTEIKIYRYDTVFTVLQLEYRTGDKLNIIYENKKRKHIKIPERFYTFDKETFMFKFTVAPIDLVNEYTVKSIEDIYNEFENKDIETVYKEFVEYAFNTYTTNNAESLGKYILDLKTAYNL